MQPQCLSVSLSVRRICVCAPIARPNCRCLFINATQTAWTHLIDVLHKHDRDSGTNDEIDRRRSYDPVAPWTHHGAQWHGSPATPNKLHACSNQALRQRMQRIANACTPPYGRPRHINASQKAAIDTTLLALACEEDAAPGAYLGGHGADKYHSPHIPARRHFSLLLCTSQEGQDERGAGGTRF